MSPLDKNPNKDSSQKGRIWKSLDEYKNSDQFKKQRQNEFPFSPYDEPNTVNRRTFLNLMGSSMALAGISGCKSIRRPEEKILPYNNTPEHVIPGNPLYFASSIAIGEEVMGVVVENHEGRPTKIEGNKLHPASLGATQAIHQATLLDLYDPFRAKVPSHNGKQAKWDDFWMEYYPKIALMMGAGGEGLRFLSDYVTSPSLGMIQNHLKKRFPKSKWHSWEPVHRDNCIEGIHAATGQWLNPHYRLDRAIRIFSVDCDFLDKEINNIPNTRGFTQMRNSDADSKSPMNRLYMVESQYSLTGGRADHRLALKPSQIPGALWQVADYLFNELKLKLPSGLKTDFKILSSKSAKKMGHTIPDKWLKALCEDLIKFPRQSLICVGKEQPPSTHALAHVLNQALGSIGRTITYKPNSTLSLNENMIMSDSITQLVEDMRTDKVSTLIILSGNPVYNAPSDLLFGEVLKKVENTVYLGAHPNQTAKACQWHLPQSHFLETWNDHKAYDGTVSICQPLIAPLYSSLSPSEFLTKFSHFSPQNSYDIVQSYWQSKAGASNFEKKWRRWIHDGLIKRSHELNIAAGIKSSTLLSLLKKESLPESSNEAYQIIFRQDPSLFDGRFVHNGWLQEMPDPVTRLTWDNAAIMGVSTAEKLGIKNDILLKNGRGMPMGDFTRPLVEITVNNTSVQLPACVLPGISSDTILLNIGYGQTDIGPTGNNVGFDVSKLRSGASYFNTTASSVKATGKQYKVANVQEHWSMEGRDLARLDNINHPTHRHHEEGSTHGPYPSLWEEHKYDKGQQWGMSIDLNKCTGCGACVVACQAENNIPIVGKDQVSRNREMHWIRTDRYFIGDDLDNPKMIHQPVACSQCEMAPCEAVCPVAATAHSKDGLNDMAYNRCVGTRYCANNCPYKVRRFNYYNFTNKYTETQKMAQNPDVTVRFRGVMEKCTYCVQRINEKRIAFKNKGKEFVPDGEITPACAQVCPAGAIVFGDINDIHSQVAKEKKNKRAYDLLAEVNIRPRTSFLSRVFNPNPQLENSGEDNNQHDNHEGHS